jgi:hypothetical protein
VIHLDVNLSSIGQDGHIPEATSDPVPHSAFDVTLVWSSPHELCVDLTALLDEAGIKSHTSNTEDRDPTPGRLVDNLGLPSEIVTIFVAAGGLGGIAAVLKTFFNRHKGKTVMFGKDYEILQTDGFSTKEIIRLLDALSQHREEPTGAAPKSSTNQAKSSQRVRLQAGLAARRAARRAPARSETPDSGQ